MDKAITQDFPSSDQPNLSEADLLCEAYLELEADLNTNRELVYHWLSSLFAKELSSDLLASYQSKDGKEFLTSLKEETSLSPVITRLEQLLDNGATEKIALDLAGTYARLFHGLAGRRSAPPYQSAYSEMSDRLFQAPVSEMNQILRSLDMSLPPDFHEPTDHLSVQLSVMAKLVACKDLEGQLSFLTGHLLSWLPNFAERCGIGDRTGFYAAAAQSLLGWLKAEQTTIEQYLNRMSN